MSGEFDVGANRICELIRWGGRIPLGEVLSGRIARRIGTAVLVGGSMAWTVYAWLSGTFRPVVSLAEASVFAVGVAVSEALFVLGLVFMAASLPSAARPTSQATSAGAVMKLRSRTNDLLGACADNRVWRAGFYLNWAGAIASAMMLMATVFVLMPSAAWGLVLVLSLDLVATFGLRTPLHRTMRERTVV